MCQWVFCERAALSEDPAQGILNGYSESLTLIELKASSRLGSGPSTSNTPQPGAGPSESARRHRDHPRTTRAVPAGPRRGPLRVQQPPARPPTGRPPGGDSDSATRACQWKLEVGTETLTGTVKNLISGCPPRL